MLQFFSSTIIEVHIYSAVRAFFHFNLCTVFHHVNIPQFAHSPFQNFLFCIRVQPINSIVIVLGEW